MFAGACNVSGPAKSSALCHLQTCSLSGQPLLSGLHAESVQCGTARRSFLRAGASALAVCSRHRPRVALRQQRRQGPREGLPEAARLVGHVRVGPRLVRDGLVPVRVSLRVSFWVHK